MCLAVAIGPRLLVSWAMNRNDYSGRGSSMSNSYAARDNYSGGGGGGKIVYDGKRMRKAVTRRTIDFNASIIRGLQVSLKVGVIVINHDYLGKEPFRKKCSWSPKNYYSTAT